MIFGTMKELRGGKYERIFCWLPTHLKDGRWMWLEHCWREIVLDSHAEYYATNPADNAQKDYVARCAVRYGQPWTNA
jgi:hypothetical protein